jgi:hypothetical protein
MMLVEGDTEPAKPRFPRSTANKEPTKPIFPADLVSEGDHIQPPYYGKDLMIKPNFSSAALSKQSDRSSSAANLSTNGSAKSTK